MSATNSKGLKVYMTKAAPTVTQLVPTAITGGNPTVVTVADITGLSVGDIAGPFTGVGMPALEGKSFVITAVGSGANTFTVAANSTGQTFAAGAGGAKVSVTHAADMVTLCLSNITLNPETPGTISAATYCDPSATLPSNVVSAGTITLDGFIDPQDTGYAELLLAAEDGIKRWIDVQLPAGYGHILFPVTLSSVSFGLPLDGAISFSASGALGSKPIHQF